MNNKDWERMRFMVCTGYSANMYETEADAVEALNKTGDAWLFEITVREIPTKIIETKIKRMVIDHLNDKN